MVVLFQSLPLLIRQIQRRKHDGVVIVRAVLAVRPVDDQAWEPIGLGPSEKFAGDVRTKAVELMVVDVDDGGQFPALLKHAPNGFDVRPHRVHRPVHALPRILDADLQVRVNSGGWARSSAPPSQNNNNVSATFRSRGTLTSGKNC